MLINVECVWATARLLFPRRGISNLPFCSRELLGAPRQRNSHHSLDNISHRLSTRTLFSDLHLLQCDWHLTQLDSNSEARMRRGTNAHQNISVHLCYALHAGSLFEMRSNQDLIIRWSWVLAASENSLTLVHGRALTRVMHKRTRGKLSVSAHQAEVFTDEHTDAGEVRVAEVVWILTHYIHTCIHTGFAKKNKKCSNEFCPGFYLLLSAPLSHNHRFFPIY